MILRGDHQQLSLILFVFDLSKNMTESIWKNNFYSLKMSIAKKKKIEETRRVLSFRKITKKV